MPLFFLHQRGGALQVEDTEGVDLPSLGDARCRAIVGIRSILAAEVMQGEVNLHEWIDIEDEAGAILMRVPFREAVRLAL